MHARILLFMMEKMVDSEGIEAGNCSSLRHLAQDTGHWCGDRKYAEGNMGHLSLLARVGAAFTTAILILCKYFH